MAAIKNAFYDLGSGLGYIYVTDTINSTPTAINIVKTLENDADGLREAKIYGLQAASLASNRVGTAIYTINAPTGVGSITNIKVGAVELIDPAVNIAYTGATTANDLAQDIVDAINNYTTGTTSQNYTAARIANTLYVFTNPTIGSSANKSPITFTATGFFTTTEVQAIQGGSSNTKVYDEGIGYRFFVDADYDANGCSGAGTATVNDLTRAVEVTNYLVFIGLQSAMPLQTVTLSSDAFALTRKASYSVVNLTGEGSADDDLNTIVFENMEIGDKILLISTVNTITLNDFTVASGNVKLKTTTYAVNGASMIELIYNVDGYWYEVSRSTQVIGSMAEYRTGGFGIFSLETYNSAAVPTSGTINFEPSVSSKYQKLTGSATLVGNLTYTFTGSPVNGDEFWMEYDASVTVGAFGLSIFGVTLTADQALNGGLMVYARYLGGSWYAHVYPNLNDASTYTFQAATEFYKDASVTVAKVETTLKTELLIVDVSFDTDRTGDYKVKLPYACTVNEINAWATDTIEATDDADLNFKDASLSSMGSESFTAGDTIGTGITTITPSSNNVFAADEILTITTTKTTKGGNAKCSIKITKS